MNLVKNLKVLWVKALVGASSSTDSNTAILDMAGYDGVVFITPITTATSGGVATLTVEQNDANSDSGMAAITGAVATKTSASNGTLLVVDVYRPTKRYVQGVLTSATQNVTFDATIAIQYKGVKAPVTADTTVAALTAIVGV